MSYSPSFLSLAQLHFKFAILTMPNTYTPPKLSLTHNRVNTEIALQIWITTKSPWFALDSICPCGLERGFPPPELLCLTCEMPAPDNAEYALIEQGDFPADFPNMTDTLNGTVRCFCRNCGHSYAYGIYSARSSYALALAGLKCHTCNAPVWPWHKSVYQVPAQSENIISFPL